MENTRFCYIYCRNPLYTTSTKQNLLILDTIPAVHNNRSCIGRIDSLDLLEEFEHTNGWEWHPEVWPAGEVKLCDQPGGSWTVAALLWRKGAWITSAINRWYKSLYQIQQSEFFSLPFCPIATEYDYYTPSSLCLLRISREWSLKRT